MPYKNTWWHVLLKCTRQLLHSVSHRQISIWYQNTGICRTAWTESIFFPFAGTNKACKAKDRNRKQKPSRTCKGRHKMPCVGLYTYVCSHPACLTHLQLLCCSQLPPGLQCSKEGKRGNFSRSARVKAFKSQGVFSCYAGFTGTGPILNVKLIPHYQIN